MMRIKNNKTNYSSDDNNKSTNKDGSKNKYENDRYIAKDKGKARIIRMKSKEWNVISLS
jgi:hypothetical protein